MWNFVILELDAAKREIDALKTSLEEEKLQKTQSRLPITILFHSLNYTNKSDYVNKEDSLCLFSCHVRWCKTFATLSYVIIDFHATIYLLLNFKLSFLNCLILTLCMERIKAIRIKINRYKILLFLKIDNFGLHIVIKLFFS